MTTVPSYLAGYEDLYAEDPRQAALTWFRDAKYGLFLHYGLYSLLGRHEWVQFREKIPVAEYEKLKEDFTAENFDADYIADFALECGMKYVNITTRHHDSFCLFETQQTDFNSVNSPCGRDLVGELAEACAARGLGLCLYYSHGRDWRHPHAPNNDEWGGSARPDYDPPEPSYAYGDDHDLSIYLDFMRAQIEELLTGYGPLAAIWLDGIAVPLSGDPSAFRCQELGRSLRVPLPGALRLHPRHAAAGAGILQAGIAGHGGLCRAGAQGSRLGWQAGRDLHHDDAEVMGLPGGGGGQALERRASLGEGARGGPSELQSVAEHGPAAGWFD